MLYADDTVLLLGDTNMSLYEAIAVITNFGVYSSLIIDWSKSLITLSG